MRSILDSGRHTIERVFCRLCFSKISHKSAPTLILLVDHFNERGHIFRGNASEQPSSEYFMLSSDITNLEWGEDLCLPDPSSISLEAFSITINEEMKREISNTAQVNFIAELWHSTFNVFLVSEISGDINFVDFGSIFKRKTVLNKQLV